MWSRVREKVIINILNSKEYFEGMIGYFLKCWLIFRFSLGLKEIIKVLLF